MNIATLIALVVLVTLAVAAIVYVLVVGKKQGEDNPTIFAKIRPIISKALMQAIVFYNAGVEGFEELNEQVVTWLKTEIDAADFLTADEKMFLSYELISSFVKPQLKALWDKGMLSQLETEAMAALEM